MRDYGELQFPRHVHAPSHPPDWVSKIVPNAEECDKALDEGWSLTPIIKSEEPVVEHPDEPQQIPPPDYRPDDTPIAPFNPPVVAEPAKRKGWPAGKKRGPRKPKEVTT
jgi:hypothetical protein